VIVTHEREPPARKTVFRPLQDVPGALQTIYSRINNRGQTIGSYFNAAPTPNPDGSFPEGTSHGFLRDARGQVGAGYAAGEP
jgi:hypothetical protein